MCASCNDSFPQLLADDKLYVVLELGCNSADLLHLLGQKQTMLCYSCYSSAVTVPTPDVEFKLL